MTDHKVLLGANSDGEQVFLLGKMANRHGLVSGATGTGKTVSLQVLAEGFAKMGTSVFVADVKGDLSGIATAASAHPKIQERIDKIQIQNYQSRAYPTVFWDIFGQYGHALRTSISEVGPILLSRILNLNDTQESVLHMAFSIADDEGLLLLDLDDLRSLLVWMGDHAKEIKQEYGNFSPATLGAIQRNLLVLKEAGGEQFFAEPAFETDNLLQKDFSGNGVISVLDARKLIADPRMYSTFLLWLLSELFENLPEVGDPEKPELVFFFDEAHLLFDDAPKNLIEKIEQVARLIRSKGVGVYFVTQNPLDIPDAILGQLGHKVQHALRAFTPKDKKAIDKISETFRENPSFETKNAIMDLGIGEALVSVLDDDGSPTVVDRTLICPPESRIGPLSSEERETVMSRSPFKGRYDEIIDRESAHEVLLRRAEEAQKKAEEAKQEQSENRKPKGRQRQSLTEAITKSFARSVASSLGRRIIRGVLGSIFK